MAASKFIVTFILFIIAICAIDAIAMGLTNADEGHEAKGTSLMSQVGWIIWDFMAIVAQTLALIPHAVFFMFGVDGADPIGCMWNIFQAANSLVYHIIYFLTEAVFGPAELANTIMVAIFENMGWDTSTKTVYYGLICHVYDGGEHCDELYEETVQYIGIGNIPLLGDALNLFGEIIGEIVGFANYLLGDPDTHTGGVYEIINISAKDPVTKINWGIPKWFKEDVLYPPFDLIITPLVYVINAIDDTWQWMLRIDILSFAGLKSVIYDAILWIFDFLPKPADTRAIFWNTFGLKPPRITYFIGGEEVIEIVPPPTEDAPVWEAPLVNEVYRVFRDFVDSFSGGELTEGF